MADAHGGAEARRYTQIALDPRLRSIEVVVPSTVVADFARGLAACWLAAAAAALELADGAWLPAEQPRGFTSTVRGFAFDGVLAQLLGEPLGAILLVTPGKLESIT